jgi:tRNA-specific 2-thiouridylase
MKNVNAKTVVVGMSGGVDSSVTAALLKKQGLHVIGVYMKNWSEDVGDYGCTWAQDSEDARKVAKVLGIPFYVWNFEKEYYDKVVEYFFREYKAGRTPNPDVMCNSEIKFKVFLEKALALGADYVATGHYARIKAVGNSQKRYKLLKGIDPAKDQSYFLNALTQKQLSRILFPIGSYPKPEVRKLAKKFKLPVWDKKDSQGICFIGKINVVDFLREHIKAKPGDMVTTAGEKVGTHTGLPFYTLGQRGGIGIGGNGPYYVVNKDLKKNRLIVTNDPEDKRLWRSEFTVGNITWTDKAPKFPLKAGVTIRYHHPDYKAKIIKLGKNLKVVYDKPQRAITPGQAAVIYKGSELLGGGVIEKIK